MFGLGICTDCLSIYIKKKGGEGRCCICYSVLLAERSMEIILSEVSQKVPDSVKQEEEKVEEIKVLTQHEVDLKIKIHDMLREERKLKKKGNVIRKRKNREEKNKKYLNEY